MLKEEFVKRAIELYGDKYDYSNIPQTFTTKDKLQIICHKVDKFGREHGLFEKKVEKFLKGQGCTKCSGRYKRTKEDFVFEANKVHDGLYSYNTFDYKDMHTKGEIYCTKHDLFFQMTPQHHISGQGCPKCAQKYNYTTKEFIELCKEVHNNFYSYDKCEYIRAFDDIIVTCPEHGDFTIKAYQHKQGKGCPLCHSSSMEVEIRNFLSNNNIEFEEQKTFEWLKYETNMFLDFYLPQYQIAIECQGEQHFKPIEFFGGKEKFDLHLDRDKRKLELCNKYDITILYFSNLGIKYPYNVFENKDLLLEEIKKYDKDK